MDDRLLEAKSLSLYLEAKELFYAASFSLSLGERVGLVGNNGVGKSSLLKILAGQLKATDGSFVLAPASSLYLLDDAINEDLNLWQAALEALTPLKELERDLRAEEERLAAGKSDLESYGRLATLFEAKGGYEAELTLKRHLAEFGFEGEWLLQSVASLSGGERMRLKLAMALARQADVLLLDEPTNHLDIRMKRYLQKRLLSYSGGLLVASHDRALLNAVCTKLLVFEGGKLVSYKGNYEAYQTQLLISKKTRKKHRQVQARQEQKLRQSYTAPAFQKAEKRRKKLMAGLAKSASSEDTVEQTKQMTLNSREAKGLLVSFKHLSKQFEATVILQDAQLQIYAADRIALLGPNGSGKSTLLKLLAGELASDHPKVDSYWHKDTKLYYFDQHNRGLQDDLSILEQLEFLVSRERAKMLLALVDLNINFWHKLPNEVSSGQRARAGIAKLIASEANLILLDEPSNALDINMIEMLEQTLQDSQAALVLATHDEMLVQSLGTKIWALENAELVHYRGGLEGYFKANKQVEAMPFIEPLEQTNEVNFETQLESLELERLSLEQRLLDPALLTERERDRAKLRLVELMNDLSVLYDSQYPEPLASYQVSFSGLTVSSNGFEGKTCVLSASQDIHMLLRTASETKVAHLSFKTNSHCLLFWAKEALLKAVIQIAFEHLELTALQLQDDANYSQLGFKSAANDWWILNRSHYEHQLKLIRSVEHKPKRKRKRRKRKAKQAPSLQANKAQEVL